LLGHCFAIKTDYQSLKFIFK